MSELRPAAPALQIDRLSVSYAGERGTLQALREVSLSVPRGRIVGLVGESGCGKSTLIAAVMRLLAANATITSGAIRLGGQDLLALDESTMRQWRGSRLSVVFQDPMSSLNPVLSIGQQMHDIQYRLGDSTADKRQRSLRMLDSVGLPDPAQRLRDYPHQLSGGMKQRVAIAMALMMQPELLIADEPTTALDATLEVQIIQRLKELQSRLGCAILFISHHLGVIAELCDEVAVMYAGAVVESGPVKTIFDHPQHPYTQKLLACDPGAIAERSRRLPVIEGQLPDLAMLPPGCVFGPRCDRADARCSEIRPDLAPTAAGSAAACHHPGAKR